MNIGERSDYQENSIEAGLVRLENVDADFFEQQN